jgi:4-amino-4-deoxy-L-arabinose transferase-like glycosyltransferase
VRIRLEEETTAKQSRKPWLMQLFLLIYLLLCYWWISAFREGSERQNSSSPQTFFVHFPWHLILNVINTKEVQKCWRVKYISTPKRCSIEDIIHFINYISGRRCGIIFHASRAQSAASYKSQPPLYSSFLSITSIKIVVGPPYGSLGSHYSLSFSLV